MNTKQEYEGTDKFHVIRENVGKPVAKPHVNVGTFGKTIANIASVVAQVALETGPPQEIKTLNELQALAEKSAAAEPAAKADDTNCEVNGVHFAISSSGPHAFVSIVAHGRFVVSATISREQGVLDLSTDRPTKIFQVVDGGHVENLDTGTAEQGEKLEKRPEDFKPSGKRYSSVEEMLIDNQVSEQVLAEFRRLREMDRTLLPSWVEAAAKEIVAIEYDADDEGYYEAVKKLTAIISRHFLASGIPEQLAKYEEKQIRLLDTVKNYGEKINALEKQLAQAEQREQFTKTILSRIIETTDISNAVCLANEGYGYIISHASTLAAMKEKNQ